MTPGVKIGDPSELCVVFSDDTPTLPVNEGSTDWGMSVTSGTEICGCERVGEDIELGPSDGF